VAPKDLAPPVIELPSESNSTNEMPAKKSGGMAPRRTPAPALMVPEMQSSLSVPAKGTPAGRVAPRRSARNTQVAGIQLDERFTGAMEREGVSVAIEPRDAQGRPCLAAAPISVVVLDPALPGETARVARWDFSAEDVAAMLRQSSPEEGLRLAMPWPEQPPTHKQLHLYVRYTTDNGQKLQADCPLQLESSAQPSSQPSAQQADTREPGLLPPSAPTAEEPPAAIASRPTWSPERR